METISNWIGGAFVVALSIGYTVGPFMGLWAAFENGSFMHAIWSLILPFYGIVYWFVA